MPHQNFRVGMVYADLFSKCMNDVPILSKTPPGLVAGLWRTSTLYRFFETFLCGSGIHNHCRNYSASLIGIDKAMSGVEDKNYSDRSDRVRGPTGLEPKISIYQARPV